MQRSEARDAIVCDSEHFDDADGGCNDDGSVTTTACNDDDPGEW